MRRRLYSKQKVKEYSRKLLSVLSVLINLNHLCPKYKQNLLRYRYKTVKQQHWSTWRFQVMTDLKTPSAFSTTIKPPNNRWILVSKMYYLIAFINALWGHDAMLRTFQMPLVPKTDKYILNKWQTSWNSSIGNTLFEIKPFIGDYHSVVRSIRK